ncbi:MAG: DUF2442 domain-containing protein [Cellulosilyticaceae bacterium]
MTPRVVKVKTNDDYTMDLTFADGKCKRFDCNELKTKGQFKIIQDLNKFHNAIIDDLGSIGWNIDESINSDVVWSNRIDVCKDVLYSDGEDIIEIADKIFEEYDKVFRELS